MEIRKIIIVESGGQKKTVIETGAETLSQLKAELDRVGIDYNDKTFFEGLSKTELTHDDSLLPRDIPRNGATTNNLVFMLTTPQKKIKSGAMDRREAYAKIRELGLQGKCIELFGRNFTMCKTEDLISLINDNMKPEVSEDTIEVIKGQAAAEAKTETVESMAIKALLNILYDNDCISDIEVDDVVSILGGNSPIERSFTNSPYSEEEIEDMIRESGLY